MSTLGEHQGSGIRFDMHLSAPNGGVAKMLCRPEGQWVSWNEYEKLKAEVERLRKAGDGLYKSMLEIGCNEMADNFQYDSWWGSMKAWNAAKEGKQP